MTICTVLLVFYNNVPGQKRDKMGKGTDLSRCEIAIIMLVERSSKETLNITATIKLLKKILLMKFELY